jgi:hypothetical protein
MLFRFQEESERQPSLSIFTLLMFIYKNVSRWSADGSIDWNGKRSGLEAI